jgi:hypothetical protein
MGVNGQHHAPAAFYPRGKYYGTHCTGGWVGPRAGLDAETRRKILCPCRGSNPGRPVRSQSLYWLSYPGSMIIVWTVFTSLSATPPYPLIPLHFTSNGSRAHRFAQATVPNLVKLLLRMSWILLHTNWAIWIVIHAMSISNPDESSDISVSHYISWYNRKQGRVGSDKGKEKKKKEYQV